MHPQQTFPLDAFRMTIPFDLQATNVPGAVTTPGPPADCDPCKASAATLVKHGRMWRRPQRADAPALRRAWDRAFTRRWFAGDRIVPILEPQPGRTHVL